MSATEVSEHGLRRWERQLRALFAPPYRPGLLIAKVRQDLRDLELIAVDSVSAQLQLAHADLRFSVHEEVDSRFLMHIVMAEFVQTIPCATAGQGSIIVRHSGVLQRTGVDFELSRDASEACRRVRDVLARDDELRKALMPLDFTACTLAAGADGFELRLRHFGACEIVGTLPRFRRYIKLAATQRASLLASFTAFKRLLQTAS